MYVFNDRTNILSDIIEENPNENQSFPVNQAIRKMKLREYYIPSESQTYTKISTP